MITYSKISALAVVLLFLAYVGLLTGVIPSPLPDSNLFIRITADLKYQGAPIKLSAVIKCEPKTVGNEVRRMVRIDYTASPAVYGVPLADGSGLFLKTNTMCNWAHNASKGQAPSHVTGVPYVYWADTFELQQYAEFYFSSRSYEGNSPVGLVQANAEMASENDYKLFMSDKSADSKQFGIQTTFIGNKTLNFWAMACKFGIVYPQNLLQDDSSNPALPIKPSLEHISSIWRFLKEEAGMPISLGSMIRPHVTQNGLAPSDHKINRIADRVVPVAMVQKASGVVYEVDTRRRAIMSCNQRSRQSPRVVTIQIDGTVHKDLVLQDYLNQPVFRLPASDAITFFMLGE